MATININKREVVKTNRNGRVIEAKNIINSYSTPATNPIDWAEVTPDLVTINRDLKVTGNITATEDVIAYVAGAVSSDVLASLSVNAPLEKVGTNNIKLNINPAQMQVNGSNQLEVIPGILAPAAHSHLISDVTGLQTSLDSKLSTSLKGAVNGLAELDANGFVKNAQLPSYVDDVLEFASSLFLPATGETGKIYITTNDNKTYRWSGSTYAEISQSLALGVTAQTAYRGDLGNVAYTHSQTTHDKNLVGLANVDNTSDASKPVSTATQTALNLKAPLASPAFTGNVGINVASPTVPLQIAYESNALDSVNPLVVGSYTTGANKVGVYTKIFSSSPFGGGYVFKTYKRNVGAYDAVTIDDSGNVVIGATSQKAKFTVINSVAGSLPPTTGTTINATAEFGSNGENQRLYIGNNTNSPYGSWLQVSNQNDLSLNYPLMLNPNGGNVGIGYSSGTEITNNKLAVNGSGYFNGNLTLGSNLNYAGTLSLTKTVDGYNIVNLRGTTNYPSRLVLYGAGDTTIQASISQAGYGDTYFKSPVWVGGYTADPTTGNKFAVSGNSYFKGVLTVDAYNTTTSLPFGSAAGVIIKSNKTETFGSDNSLLFRTETSDMGGISSVYNSYSGGISGANLDFYTRTSATTVDRILRLASDKNATFAGGATFNGFITASGLTVEAGTYDWNITQSSGNLKFDHYGTNGVTIDTSSTITANELNLYALDADILKTNDTGQVRIGGGSVASSANGATLQCFGNDYTTAAYKGQVRLIAGKGDGTTNFGSIYFSTVDSALANTERFRITGGATIATASFSACNVTVSGNITASGEVTAYSDERLKSNIQPLKVRGELKPVTYIKDNKESIGFIAQDIKEIYPELVKGDESKEMLSLNYQQLTAVLYAEILELKERIKRLEGEK